MSEFNEPWSYEYSEESYREATVKDKSGKTILIAEHSEGVCPEEIVIARIVACVNLCAGANEEAMQKIMRCQEMLGALTKITMNCIIQESRLTLKQREELFRKIMDKYRLFLANGKVPE